MTRLVTRTQHTWGLECEMPTIRHLIENVDSFDADDIIFAKLEWTENSEARLFRPTEDFRAPAKATELGFKYR
ncbi:hypothetical protein AKJ09_06931 [Labilithrix luteola]|uniref:Uncharacterized protein n=1 Tax=Labilithrix luteola TaxID=1391654 RepID=A0A0K1Q3G3_9BACT|nr:hypothetical protein [Labilithrix luteola]AKV00268.1 hypothetical protein AKJ09_06931 [Labilithrix luteola]